MAGLAFGVLGLAIGIVIGWFWKGQDDEKTRQRISDKLDRAIQDIETTV